MLIMKAKYFVASGFRLRGEAASARLAVALAEAVSRKIFRRAAAQSTESHAGRVERLKAEVTTAIAATAFALAVGVLAFADARRPVTFAPDDPLWREPETQDASGAEPREVFELTDFVEQTFAKPGDRRACPAQNLNTLDEVPDSGWFANRLGRQPLSIEEVARGPGSGHAPETTAWTIVGAKPSGVSPGFVLQDAKGDRYFVKLDGRDTPELATGAEVIATRLFHAFGYFVPENHLATLDPEQLQIAPGVRVPGTLGKTDALISD